MTNQRGKFIVFYGTNNLGKTLQARKLVGRMTDMMIPVMYLKYPVYDLRPSGPLLNEYLREGNPHKLSAREAQLLYTQNRTQFEPKLLEYLNAGVTVIAEDYKGTGIAWGSGAGVDQDFLKEINSHLLEEDLAFIFHGQRFAQSKEKGHLHESNDEFTERVQEIHLALGKEYGWHPIVANDSIDAIHEKIWAEVKTLLNL
ncbi:MAG: hypothetical protein COV29_00395 [Candidatus Yanofskybacteria bacterium CG10_big_fil_rev_8_21_14_0_10_36_16]|uniref:Thymidylate kinase-like domain-containing protein n=1 Tax=Candidatus Yanofskybacteria bacterium CG10_big_fil_rev_8_21_14_0_10_36_16 TaxID=1975096 RepID=A0A2J0Q8K9_9BACT|nr:MAG: hypothetical protein COV29_00395 [Candidatus Yanofskybacteria bacterium CG10_big_fil_rev_8_21_14_0_10_36_16]